ncbi:unnamed protein product, partial [Mesorhabditis spiculigera]
MSGPPNEHWERFDADGKAEVVLINAGYGDENRDPKMITGEQQQQQQRQQYDQLRPAKRPADGSSPNEPPNKVSAMGKDPAGRDQENTTPPSTFQYPPSLMQPTPFDMFGAAAANQQYQLFAAMGQGFNTPNFAHQFGQFSTSQQHTPGSAGGYGTSTDDSGIFTSPNNDQPSSPDSSDELGPEADDEAEAGQADSSMPTNYLASSSTATQLAQGGPADASHENETEFDLVPARHALLSASTKYKVTVGEIRRRLSPPECLHASLLNGILRKAKSKDGGKALRSRLQEYAIELPLGRRKTSPATAFTALCEEEAYVMGHDFEALVTKNLSTKDLAQYLVDKTKKENHLMLHERQQQLVQSKRFLSEMLSVFQSGGIHPRDYHRLHNTLGQATNAVQNFGLVTHGFGPYAFCAVIQGMMGICDAGLNQLAAEIAVLGQRQPQQPSHQMPMSFLPPNFAMGQPGFPGGHPMQSMYPPQGQWPL